MEYQYDLVWNETKWKDPAAVAGSLETDPVMLINPKEREHPAIMDDLFRP